MNEPRVLECTGAPRDLGYDQGSRVAEAVRREVRGPGSLLGRLFRVAPSTLAPTDLVERDLIRHFPHLGERTAGLARGVGVTRSDLARLLARELAVDDDRFRRAASGMALAVTPERTGGGALVARTLELPRGRGFAFRVRRSTPENDYRSVEVLVPWLVAPVAGVNEHGLAVAVTSVPPSRRTLGGCLAPATLLVQDCLQRFDTAEKAIDWCRRRPAGGCASLVMADASGEVAAIIVDGNERRLRTPDEGLLLGIGRSLRKSTIEAECDSRTKLDVDALFSVLASHAGTTGDDDTPCRHGEQASSVGLLFLEPSRSSLALVERSPCRSTPQSLHYFTA